MTTTQPLPTQPLPTLSLDERAIVRAISRAAEAGRFSRCRSITARAVASSLTGLPAQLANERTVSVLLDLIGIEASSRYKRDVVGMLGVVGEVMAAIGDADDDVDLVQPIGAPGLGAFRGT